MKTLLEQHHRHYRVKCWQLCIRCVCGRQFGHCHATRLDRASREVASGSLSDRSESRNCRIQTCTT